MIRSSATEMSEDRSNLKQGKCKFGVSEVPWSHYQC